MNTDFIITDISRIIFVDTHEYPEKHSVYDANFKHNELIFHFPVEPEDSPVSTTLFNEKTEQIYPNSIRFLPRGDNKKYEIFRHRKSNGCIDICFDSDIPPFNELTLISCAKNKKIEELFRRIFIVWNTKNQGYRLECMSLLYKIFAEIQKQNYMTDKQYALIKPAIEKIEREFLNPNLTCESLAEECKISYCYFKKLFYRKFNTTPKRYIIQMKINYACDLLSSRLYTVNRVSEMAGFNDIGFFCRQFKNYTGVSPKEYQKNYKSSK